MKKMQYPLTLFDTIPS